MRSVLRLPWWASAEDAKSKLVRGCPRHAFQMFVRGSGGGRMGPDLRRSVRGGPIRTALDGAE